MSAFNAFQEQLKTLCLSEFPCGFGTWREPIITKIDKNVTTSDCLSLFSATLRDYGPQYEKTEALKEAISDKKSPWKLDSSWSNEAQDLRLIAVQTPWLINDKFVWNHFKTLKIVDKEVTEIDEDFLKLQNLQELSLTANQLTTVDSKHLPPKLQVLELCANQISSLTELSEHPPKSLIHLGLGYNKISETSDCLTGKLWPKLLSLDLSHNDLTDLMALIGKLQTLPSLRNLTLVGNPLALIPAYRGYVVDSLKELEYLDDMHISFDERNLFKGLSKKREHILDEAKLTLNVDILQGIPMPDELKNPDEYPEFPVVTKTYFVRVMFLEPRQMATEILPDHMATPQVVVSEVQPGSPAALSSIFEEVTVMTPQEELSDEQVDGNKSPVGEKEGSERRLIAIDSPKLEWAEQIELKWEETLQRDSLLELRDFFKGGLDLMVMEQKVCSMPVQPEAEMDPVATPKDEKAGKAGKGDKKDKKDKKDDKSKEADKGKKKKKEDIEMSHSPPEFTELAKFHVATDSFLEGNLEITTVFQRFDDALASDRSRTPDSQLEKKKLEKKPPSTAKKDAKGKDAGKQSAKGKKDAKGKGKMPVGDEDEDQPPPPLEMDFKLTLHQWKSVLECEQ